MKNYGWAVANLKNEIYWSNNDLRQLCIYKCKKDAIKSSKETWEPTKIVKIFFSEGGNFNTYWVD